MSYLSDVGFYILLVIGILELLFGLYFLIRYEKSMVSILFGLSALMVGGWVLSNGIGVLFARGSFMDDLLGRATSAFSALIFPIMYLFVQAYPFATFKINKRFIVFLFSLPIALVGLIFFSKSLIIGFEKIQYGPTIYGNLFLLYTAYIVSMFIFISTEILIKLPKLDNLHRRQLSYFFIAILISGIIGMMFNLILPYFFNARYLFWLGPASSLIWLGLMWKVVKQKV